ncbi:DUF937 domain-containing protein [Deinococcus metallilatus]|uniref:DUF937 domain-containing protein n=1 Tax=Deinococcus metallilatus TaxID=1211322 RepID=A0AAJ5F3X5_9DEIO|nr:DUF937 domain-containing protein [Deinococcus metallilatus]MBB5295961.1 hypothetical protein [Deinococcus metallilatus]QBY08212.1 DUF937 domain-containing protein [Deinococcus metallilatus]RXJ11943.1 DUF937 domain-containing protein [Deinococcus metallilatus]TLK25825.1 DUF937 domain-containing protein [Deinococcus metallilatus]GMA14504.1 hypothetical protein GCM10025871_08350 [Deinococcus metallilatus]
MMDIFNMLGGLGQAQQTVGSRLGTSPQQTEAALEAAVPLLLGAMTRNAQTPGGAEALSGALDQHDGQALDLFGQGQMPDMQEGQKILGHVFGNQQQAAANAVSRRAGIDPQLALQILSMVAPLVLAYLSRRRQGQTQGQAGGQSGGLGGILGSILGGGGLGGILGGHPSQPQVQTQGGSLGEGPVIPGYTQPQNQGDVTGGSVLPGYPQNPAGQPGHASTGQMGGMIGTLNNVLDRDGDGNALNDLIGMFGGQRR